MAAETPVRSGPNPMTPHVMSTRIVRQCYPLFSTGIPGWISETLRTAGLAIEEMTTARWQAERRQTEERREMLVLFDSRSAASRDSASAFESGGCRLLDVAALLRSQPAVNVADAVSVRTDAGSIRHVSPSQTPAPRRLRVLERAKQQIESTGFLWARVADYPYPFQSALVDDRGVDGAARDGCAAAAPSWAARLDSPHRTILLPAAGRGRYRRNTDEPTLGRADVDDLYAQYVAGQALFVAPDLASADAAILDSALESGMFPLLWRTNSAEFAHWRRLRREFAFQIDERLGRHEIRYGQLPVHFRPAIEFWRGAHFALVPLQRSRQTIDAGQAVYQSAGRRHPAGLAALQADLESHAALLTAAARAV
jgi:hypothetical protein